MTNRIQTRIEGPFARVQLARPPVNVIDFDMMQELSSALASWTENGGRGIRVVQFETAEECRDFSAGVDVAAHAPASVGRMLQCFHGIFRLLEAAPFMTLAAVRGRCLGGGAELACACDGTIATNDAEFGFPEIRLGCFPPIAAILLPEMVGRRRASEWILTGRKISAVEAQSAGLIDMAVAPESLEEASRDLREGWLQLSAQALAIARRAIRGDRLERELQRVERLYIDELLATRDAREGVEAFIQKRPPRWSSAAAPKER